MNIEAVRSKLKDNSKGRTAIRWSIRKKLVFAFISIILIPIISITIYSMFTMTGMLKTQVSSRIKSNGIGASLMLNEEIKKYDLICLNIVNDNSLKMPMQLGIDYQVGEYRKLLFSKYKDISDLGIYMPNGTPVFSTINEFDDIVQTSLKENKAVSGLVSRNGRFGIISLKFIQSSDTSDLKGRIIGAVLLFHEIGKSDVLYKNICTKLNTYLLIYNNTTLLNMLDSEGNTIVPLKNEREYIWNPNLIKTGEYLDSEGVRISGKKFMAYYLMLKDYSGKPFGVISVAEDDSEMNRRAFGIITFMVFILVIAVLFTFMTSTLVSISFTKPIFHLMGLMKEVEDGNLSVRAYFNSKNEFGRLSVSFNKMVRELATSEERLNRAQEIAHIGNWELDTENNMLFGTKEVLKLFGVHDSLPNIEFAEILDVVIPSDKERLNMGLMYLCLKDGYYEDEFKISRKDDGLERVIHIKAVVNEIDENKRIMGIFQDITERKEIENRLRQNHEELSDLYEELSVSEEKLHEQYDELEKQKLEMEISEERYRILADNTSDFIYSYNEKCLLTAANKSLCSVLEMSAGEIIGKTHAELGFSKRYINQWKELHNKAIEEKRTVKGEIVEILEDGAYFYYDMTLSPLFDSKRKIIGITAARHDITEIKNTENKIKYLAYYDSLTGLPNRVQFVNRFENYIKESDIKCDKCAILFLDIDNFKKINDTMGHTIGDEMLKKVAERLLLITGEQSIPSRFGGDEFLILQKGVKSLAEIHLFTSKIMNIFEETWALGNNEFYLTASIGVAVYPDDGTKLEELLKNADTAMYTAKSLGKNNYQFYNNTMNDQIINKMNIEKGLRKAIKNKEFVLYYQPQVDLNSLTIRGVETLIRWNSPEMGMIHPVHFIPLAEETGLIIPIGDWVLKTACAQGKKWQDEGLSPLCISVNVSARQLKQKDFVKKVKDVLNDTGLQPEYLELEITESMLIESFELAIKALNELKEIGVKISLDDFGTGYSSLNYLKQLPINTLKIDKSFIDDINKKSIETTIIDLIISLVHKMDIEVIAEGVENRKQLDYLMDSGCDSVQGYFFSKPLSQSDAVEIIRRGHFKLD